MTKTQNFLLRFWIRRETWDIWKGITETINLRFFLWLQKISDKIRYKHGIFSVSRFTLFSAVPHLHAWYTRMHSALIYTSFYSIKAPYMTVFLLFCLKNAHKKSCVRTVRPATLRPVNDSSRDFSSGRYFTYEFDLQSLFK